MIIRRPRTCFRLRMGRDGCYILSADKFLVYLEVTVGIRARLLALAVGAALPLALLGLFDLYGVWTSSRERLSESVGNRLSWQQSPSSVGWMRSDNR